jgi:hypothetical protein
MRRCVISLNNINMAHLDVEAGQKRPGKVKSI